MSIQPIIVRGLPPVWGSPSPSPFVIKLLCWFRLAGVEHEMRPLTGPPRSRSGKIPYIERADGSVLSDSERVIALLSEERGVDLDADFDPESLSRVHVLRRMLEEHTYFVGLFERFIKPEGWARSATDYFRHLPPIIRWLLPRIVRRRTRRNLHGQGLGRHPCEVIEEKGRSDVRALASALGAREYILGARPCNADATVAAFLWAFTCNPFPSVLGDEVRAHDNLTAYLERFRKRHWADWPADGPSNPSRAQA